MNALLSLFPSDASLVRAALADASAGFEALVQRYQRKGYAIARAQGVPDGALDDVVQEAFLRAFRGLASLRDPAAFGPWFLAIVRNAARKQHRGLEAVALAGSLADALPARLPGPAEGLEGQELRDALWRRVAELPEGTREAVFLYYHEGESTRAVARTLGISTAAVKSRLQAGRDLLREKLWRELRECLRDLLPSAREWRRRGRSLAILAIASLPAAGALQGASSAPAQVGLFLQATKGGLIVSGKKLGVSAAIAAVLVLGVSVIVVDPLGWRGNNGGGDGAVAGRLPAAGERAARPAGASGAAGGAAPRADLAAPAAPAADEAAPVSLDGKVQSGGAGVPRARVIAIPIAAWNRIDAAGRSAAARAFREPGEQLRELGKAYLLAAGALPQTTSGPDGAYAFRGLEPGEYRLAVSHPGHLPSTESTALVAAGAAARCDVELLPGYSIAGKVVGADGRPLPGALVGAEPSLERAVKGQERVDRIREAWREGRLLVATREVTSAADGTFRLAPIEPTLHDLKARREGQREGRAWQVPAGATDVVLTLTGGGGVRGRVVDPGGKAVAGARAVLARSRTSEVHQLFDRRLADVEVAGGDPARADTPADGGFAFSGLEEGSYELEVTAEGFPPLARDLEVEEEVVDLGELKLEAPLEIAGIVTFPDGREAAGARVWIPRPLKKALPQNSMEGGAREILADTRSGGGGRFVLKGVPPGAFAVRADLEGHAGAVVEGVEAGTEDVRLVLLPGIEVAGRVLDEETAAPVAGAEVTIGFRENDKRGAVSDAAGAFIVRGLPRTALRNGWTMVDVRHPDFDPHADYNASVEGRDARSPLIVRLGRGERVSGRVAGPDGEPVANARVAFEVAGLSFDTMGWSPASGIVDFTAADGTFRLEAPRHVRGLITPVTLYIIVSHAAFAPGRAGPIAVPRTGDAWPEVVIELARGLEVVGTVTGADGKPIAGARVSAHRPAAGGGPVAPGLAAADAGARTAYSGPDGRYRLRGVAEGPCDLLAAALGRAPKLVAVDAAGPGPFLQDIVLEDGGSIRGRVVDAAGSPVAGTEVVALPEVVEPESSSPGAPESSEFSRRMAKLILPGDAAVRTGEDGRYEIAHLPGGAFLLVARAGGFEAAQAAGVRTGETAPDLVLGRFSAVRGTVVSAETGRPVPTFTVDVLDRKKLPGAGGDEGSRRRQIVDYRVASEGALRFHHPAGRFLYDGLRPSEYVVLVQAAGHVFARQDIALAPGEEAELSFALEAGGRLTGVVIDSETGLPIAGAPITCGRQGSRPESTIEPWYDREEVLSAEDGTFTIGGLRPGKYFVNASHPYYAPDWSAASQSIEVPAAEGSRVEIRMRPAGRLEGSVRGAPADEPGKKVQIQIVLTRVAPEAEEKPEQGRGFGGFEFLPVHLDPQGQYRADRVLPGRFKLEVKAQEVELGEQVHLGPSGGFVSHKPRGPERTLFTSEVEVEARRTTTLDIKLP